MRFGLGGWASVGFFWLGGFVDQVRAVAVPLTDHREARSVEIALGTEYWVKMSNGRIKLDGVFIGPLSAVTPQKVQAILTSQGELAQVWDLRGLQVSLARMSLPGIEKSQDVKAKPLKNNLLTENPMLCGNFLSIVIEGCWGILLVGAFAKALLMSYSLAHGICEPQTLEGCKVGIAYNLTVAWMGLVHFYQIYERACCQRDQKVQAQLEQSLQDWICVQSAKPGFEKLTLVVNLSEAFEVLKVVKKLGFFSEAFVHDCETSGALEGEGGWSANSRGRLHGALVENTGNTGNTGNKEAPKHVLPNHGIHLSHRMGRFCRNLRTQQARLVLQFKADPVLCSSLVFLSASAIASAFLGFAVLMQSAPPGLPTAIKSIDVVYKTAVVGLCAGDLFDNERTRVLSIAQRVDQKVKKPKPLFRCPSPVGLPGVPFDSKPVLDCLPSDRQDTLVALLVNGVSLMGSHDKAFVHHPIVKISKGLETRSRVLSLQTVPLFLKLRALLCENRGVFIALGPCFVLAAVQLKPQIDAWQEVSDDRLLQALLIDSFIGFLAVGGYCLAEWFHPARMQTALARFLLRQPFCFKDSKSFCSCFEGSQSPEGEADSFVKFVIDSPSDGSLGGPWDFRVFAELFPFAQMGSFESTR
jgi:hypothetical protein